MHVCCWSQGILVRGGWYLNGVCRLCFVPQVVKWGSCWSLLQGGRQCCCFPRCWCLALLCCLPWKIYMDFFIFFPTLTPKPESAVPWCKISKKSSTVPDDFNPSFLPLALHQGQSYVLELAGWLNLPRWKRVKRLFHSIWHVILPSWETL